MICTLKVLFGLYYKGWTIKIFIGFFYHTVQILFFSNEDYGFISLISLPKWENISIFTF